ncbi:MAG: hypothetical protein BWY32_01876 [bacterium ADurb.Bin243]|mgnify:CR=1 FL=1|nr:MAG: hypothetical protein BWY32_01876 [bacterium ADurb.Bin243]HOD41740.1 hypothetical protein [Candidatus Wallbacteria bacterium]
MKNFIPGNIIELTGQLPLGGSEYGIFESSTGVKIGAHKFFVSVFGPEHEGNRNSDTFTCFYCKSPKELGISSGDTVRIHGVICPIPEIYGSLDDIPEAKKITPKILVDSISLVKKHETGQLPVGAINIWPIVKQHSS